MLSNPISKKQRSRKFPEVRCVRGDEEDDNGKKKKGKVIPPGLRGTSIY